MWYIRDGETLKILIYAQPGAKSMEAVGIHDGRLKIRINTPPVDGRANHALQKFLAKRFHVLTKNVRLISGEKHRKKTFLILNSTINPENVFFSQP